MKTRVSIEGVKELDEALGQLTQSAGKGVLRRVGRKALVPFDEAWRAKAPRLSGQLQESGGIGSKLTRSQRQAHERDATVEVFAGPGPNPQAVTQEFGTVNHAAQPFMRPAWDETKDQVLDSVKDQLGAEIEKAAKRAARKAARAAGVGK